MKTLLTTVISAAMISGPAFAHHAEGTLIHPGAYSPVYLVGIMFLCLVVLGMLVAVKRRISSNQSQQT